MSPFVALEINNDQATLVAVDTAASGKISLIGRHYLNLDELSTTEPEESPDGSITALNPKPGLVQTHLERIFNIEVDDTCAVIPGRQVLYEQLVLPFRDEKQIEQVAPLQVQDLVPFDIGNFVLDNVITTKKADGSYEVISSLIPAGQVAEALAKSEKLGANPKFLTTKAVAVTGLVRLFPEQLTGTFALICLTQSNCSLAVFVNNVLKHLREFNVPADVSDVVGYPELLSHIKCSIARVSRDTGSDISRLFGIGNPRVIQRLGSLLGMNYEPLELATVVENQLPDNGDLADIAWALGVYAHETAPVISPSRPFVDFRRGSFAYQPAWGHVTSALSKELVYIIFAGISLLLYFGAHIYVGYQKLNRVEDKIHETVAQVLPNEPLPPRGQEQQYLEGKVSEIEEQLRSVGSLSSLSPLESLKELSQSIDKSLDVTVEGMELGELRLGLRGSVVDYPSVGRLQTAFEKQVGKFCSIKVDSKGKEPGSPRVKFSAEILLCE